MEKLNNLKPRLDEELYISKEAKKENALASVGKSCRSEKINMRVTTSQYEIYLTRIAERRFSTGLQRGYFFRGEGAAIHTQATIKPCGQPLHATESHMRLKHKLIQNIVPF